MVFSGFCNNHGPHREMTVDYQQDCKTAVGEMGTFTLSSVSGPAGADLPESK